MTLRVLVADDELLARKRLHRLLGELDGELAAHAPRLASAVVDGELVVIAGAHHSPQLTHPTEWRAAVETHLHRLA